MTDGPRNRGHGADASRDPEQARGDAVVRLAEDTTGFGVVELRTARDLLLQPRAALEAYMAAGATGGGCYARPLRFYLALCGVLMLVLFLMGGMKQILADWPPEVLDPLLARSGKSRDAFVADVDGWISLIMVPFTAPFFAIAVAPLLKSWDRGLDWRHAFRATFVFMNAWTLLMLPVSPLVYTQAYMAPGMAALLLLLVVAFARTGRGRWWRTWPECLARSLLLALACGVATLVSSNLVFVLGLLGAIFFA